MNLFMRLDNENKAFILLSSGYQGEVVAHKIREHFQALQAKDLLDNEILAMELNG